MGKEGRDSVLDGGADGGADVGGSGLECGLVEVLAVGDCLRGEAVGVLGALDMGDDGEF